MTSQSRRQDDDGVPILLLDVSLIIYIHRKLVELRTYHLEEEFRCDSVASCRFVVLLHCVVHSTTIIFHLQPPKSELLIAWIRCRIKYGQLIQSELPKPTILEPLMSNRWTLMRQFIHNQVMSLVDEVDTGQGTYDLVSSQQGE